MEGTNRSLKSSLLEGGGQILRNTIALSAITNQPIHIHSIRANREKKGLKAQHKCGIDLVAQITCSIVSGVSIASNEVTFTPTCINDGVYSLDIQTAGSIALIIQAVIPVLLFAKKNSRLELIGGTNAELAPQIDYMIHILQPVIEKTGVHFSIDLIQRGYYPKGQGIVNVEVSPWIVKNSIDLTIVHPITKIRGIIHATRNLRNVARIMKKHVMMLLSKFESNRLSVNFDVKKDIEIDLQFDENAVGSGSGIVLWTESEYERIYNYLILGLGGSAVGNRNTKPEMTAQLAVNELIEAIESGACVDKYLQDQLIIFMALIPSPCKILVGNIELHTKTSIHYCQKMCNVEFTIEQRNNLNLITSLYKN